MRIESNPDPNFVKNKRKEIKNNNGYCSEVKDEIKHYQMIGKPYPYDKSRMKCMCAQFAEQACSGWCMGGLYNKTIEDGDNEKEYIN